MTIWEEEEHAADGDAPPYTIWVCNACGKRASNRFNGGISHGWDESCMLNAVLCHSDSLVFNGARVVGAKAVK